jgi:hypothetical protein
VSKHVAASHTLSVLVLLIAVAFEPAAYATVGSAATM